MLESVNKWQNKEEGGKGRGGVLSRDKGFFNGSMEGCYGGSRALEEGVGSFMGGFYYNIDAFSFEPCTIARPGACQAALKFRLSVLQGVQ